MPICYNQDNNISSPTKSGEKTQPQYKKKLNPQTNKYDIYIEKIINIYDEIQEASIGTTLTEMIQKYNGDELLVTETINKNKTNIYLDTTKIKTNIIEKENERHENINKIEKLKKQLEKEQQEFFNKYKEKNEQKKDEKDLKNEPQTQQNHT